MQSTYIKSYLLRVYCKSFSFSINLSPHGEQDTRIGCHDSLTLSFTIPLLVWYWSAIGLLCCDYAEKQAGRNLKKPTLWYHLLTVLMFATNFSNFKFFILNEGHGAMCNERINNDKGWWCSKSEAFLTREVGVRKCTRVKKILLGPVR